MEDGFGGNKETRDYRRTFLATGFLAGAFLAVSLAFAAVVAARALVLLVVGAAVAFLSAVVALVVVEEAVDFFAPLTAGALFC